jgi:hypothetical protein
MPAREGICDDGRIGMSLAYNYHQHLQTGRQKPSFLGSGTVENGDLHAFFLPAYRLLLDRTIAPKTPYLEQVVPNTRTRSLTDFAERVTSDFIGKTLSKDTGDDVAMAMHGRFWHAGRAGRESDHDRVIGRRRDRRPHTVAGHEAHVLGVLAGDPVRRREHRSRSSRRRDRQSPVDRPCPPGDRGSPRHSSERRAVAATADRSADQATPRAVRQTASGARPDRLH